MNLTNVVKFLNEQQIVLELNGQVIDVSSIVGDPNNRKISIVGRYPLTNFLSVTRDPNEILVYGDSIPILPYEYTPEDNSDIPNTDGIKVKQEENILGMGEYISDHMPNAQV